jgi:hypothetical protein
MDEDNRIIDLDLDNPILPDFFRKLRDPINMTLCAGDGVEMTQDENGVQKQMTNIEWFVTGHEGHDRENKPTTIFVTTKNWCKSSLEANKEYLRSRPDLQVILLVYDDKNPRRWKENLVRLFPNLIDNIYEDVGCYCDALDLRTLNEILRENGTYQFHYTPPKIKLFLSELFNYEAYFRYFTINLQLPFTIIKDNGDTLIFPEEFITSLAFKDDDAGLEIFRLDKLNYENNRRGGGKKKKTKKSRKIKSNKTKNTKKTKKH